MMIEDKMIEEVDKKSYSKNELDKLTAEFMNFQETTNKLVQAYNILQKKFEEVNMKLSEKNKALEKSLIEIDSMKNYTESILLSISSGVVAIDLEGEITTFNKAAEIILGLSSEDIIGKKYKDTINYHNEINLEKVIRTQESIFYHEIEITNSQNEELTIEYSASPVFDSENNLLGAVEVYRDISDVKKLEKVIQQKETLVALGEMAANVAHEIRNPLGGIEGFATLLKRKLKEPAEINLIEHIIIGVKNLNNIVSSLLFYTKPLKLNYYPVDIKSIIDASITLLKSDEKLNKNVNFKKNIILSDDKIYGDGEQLKQVFINLIKNSIEAIDPKKKGEIIITAIGKNKNIEIEIRDNGFGIEEDKLKNIFNPFFTTKQNGTGLGLAICQKILEAHFGAISVESEFGKGTKFLIKLPINSKGTNNE